MMSSCVGVAAVRKVADVKGRTCVPSVCRVGRRVGVETQCGMLRGLEEEEKPCAHDALDGAHVEQGDHHQYVFIPWRWNSSVSASWLSAMTSVIIPDNVVTIGVGAFSGNAVLTTVTIGSAVKYILSDAFWLCPLTSVIIPDVSTAVRASSLS